MDKIIDVIFTTAIDVESQQEEEKEKPEIAEHSERESKRSYTDPTLLNAKREAAVAAFAALRKTDLLKRSRTFFLSPDKQLRVCCTVSKRYEGEYQPYWYAYHPKWDAFLSG